MYSLRRTVTLLAFLGLLILAAGPASATGGGCWTVSVPGVGLTESFAAWKATTLFEMKRSLWMAKGKRAHVGRPDLTCGRALFVYSCTMTARFCK